jgi:hypothetical protein
MARTVKLSKRSCQPKPAIWLSLSYPLIKKEVSQISQPLYFTGAGTGGRTPGLLITNQLLYH